MNTCILMGKIATNPELRYTPDSQLEIAQMLVEFPGLGPNDPPATLKTVAFGNLAKEIQQQYHPGEQVIIQGRLRMNTIDRQEGFKEKRAELTVSHLYKLSSFNQGQTFSNPVSSGSNNVVPINRTNPSTYEDNNNYDDFNEGGNDGNLDDIPF
jgi:single-stranded DNA-binding protein